LNFSSNFFFFFFFFFFLLLINIKIIVRKKINWYLSKNLAEIIEPKGNEEIAIRLNFVAKGKSHSDTLWGTEDRANQCCVCGTTEHLNLHHVFPYVYRKWCPELIKSHTVNKIFPSFILYYLFFEFITIILL